jgi:uncharacterized protein YbjQ (UPF0145 family)
MSTENNPSTPAYCQERKVLRHLILIALATSGCMRTSVVMLSPDNYPAVVADSVRVFLSVDEITGEYEQIALIDAYEEGECTGSLCISRESFLKELKEKAGALGANGVILDVEDLPGAAEMGRGDVAGLRALAIRMLNTPTISADLVMLTPRRYSPIAPDSVTVFLRAWDAPAEHEQIALIDAYEIGKCSLDQCPRQSAVIAELKRQASAIGANGIIIEGDLAEMRDVRRGETAVRVIAIRFQSPEPH